MTRKNVSREVEKQLTDYNSKENTGPFLIGDKA